MQSVVILSLPHTSGREPSARGGGPCGTFPSASMLCMSRPDECSEATRLPGLGAVQLGRLPTTSLSPSRLKPRAATMAVMETNGPPACGETASWDHLAYSTARQSGLVAGLVSPCEQY